MTKQNNETFDTLESLRLEIDDIDLELLILLRQRSEAVLRVKKLKDDEDHKNDIFIKPDREERILKKVVNNAIGYSSDFFFHTWRCIIAESNVLEQPWLSVFCDKHDLLAVRFFYGFNINVIHEEPLKSHIFVSKHLDSVEPDMKFAFEGETYFCYIKNK